MRISDWSSDVCSSDLFLQRHGIATGSYAVFTQLQPALAHVRAHGAPIVIKADGLAAGKGVVVAMTLAEAAAALHDLLAGRTDERRVGKEWGSTSRSRGSPDP